MRKLYWILPLAVLAGLLGSIFAGPSTQMMTDLRNANASLERSNAMIDSKNSNVIKLMEAERKNQPEKVEKLMVIVKGLCDKSNDLSTYILGLCGELNKTKDDENTRAASRLLIEGKDGELLKSRLLAYKQEMKALMAGYPVPEEMPIDVSLPDGDKDESWQKAYFHRVPKLAAIAVLDKLINDVKCTEAMCLDRLAKEAVTVEVTLDSFVPLLSAKSTYIHVGEKFEATIGLGAYSTAIIPEVYVGGRRVEVRGGIATYTAPARAAGTFKVPTLVRIPKRSGGFEDAEGELEYTVVSPTAPVDSSK